MPCHAKCQMTNVMPCYGKQVLKVLQLGAGCATGGRVERGQRERNWILELALPPCLGIGNWAFGENLAKSRQFGKKLKI